VVAAYPLLLVVLGFYDRRELAFVGRLVTRGRQRQRAAAPIVMHDETVESAGAIVDVPLAQDDDDPVPADGSGSGR
jgi:hypothetical protein